MRRLYDRPAGVHVAKLLGRNYLIVSDPETIRYVLVENAGNWRKNYGAFMRAVGRSSLVTHGDEWRAVRRVNQRAFRADRLTPIVESNRPIIDAFVDDLADKARAGTPIDVCSTFGGLMIALTSNGMFSRQSGRSASEVFADVDCFLPVMDRCALSVTAFGRWLARRSVAGFEAAVARWRLLPADLRAKAPARPEAGTLLANLVAAFDPDGTDPDGARKIADEMLLYLAAGSQTSAASLGFAFYLLWRHPEVLAAVQAQLAGITGAPSPDALPTLPLLGEVMSETLRLFPPVWAISRVALGPDTIAGVTLRTNDVVIISYHGLHRSERYWPGADQFRPERFEGAAVAARRSYTYLPFGAGPRACIGAQLASMQAVSILAAVLSRFTIEFEREATDLSDAGLRPGISLWPKRPLMARVLARQ